MSVPSLRFNGFSECWEVQTLGDMVQILSGYPFSSELFSQKGKKLVIPKNFTKDGYGNFSSEYLKFTTEECDTKYICNYGDLLLLLTDLTQNCELLGKPLLIKKGEGGVLLNQRIIKIECNEYLNKVFLMNFFLTENYHKIIKETASGSTVKHSSNKILSNLKITYPTILEQVKISNFLTAFDEKISQLTQKYDLLTQYKKGVMQQIFSQELRFKDDGGRDFPEWVEKALSDVGKSFNGLVGKAGDDFGSGQSYITYKQIFDSSKIDVTKFSFVEIGENEKQNKVRFGDVFFTTSSETPDEVGLCSVLLSEVNNVYLNSFCFGYRISSFEILSPLFAQFIFHSNGFREDVIKLAQGSTRYNISKISFMKTKVQLPCINEQTKIANFLTAIDNKITATQTQLKAVKQYKQGLLQHMFV